MGEIWTGERTVLSEEQCLMTSYPGLGSGAGGRGWLVGFKWLGLYVLGGAVLLSLPFPGVKKRVAGPD